MSFIGNDFNSLQYSRDVNHLKRKVLGIDGVLRKSFVDFV